MSFSCFFITRKALTEMYAHDSNYLDIQNKKKIIKLFLFSERIFVFIVRAPKKLLLDIYSSVYHLNRINITSRSG